MIAQTARGEQGLCWRECPSGRWGTAISEILVRTVGGNRRSPSACAITTERQVTEHARERPLSVAPAEGVAL